MPYRHAGSIGDIWKHPPLYEILLEQKPKVYLESNSAYPEYTIYPSSEKLYGIYHYLANYRRSGPLSNAKYTSLIEKTWNSVDVNADANLYLGSPGLVLGILKECAKKFIFFDLDRNALDAIRAYAKSYYRGVKVQTIQGDSIKGTLNLLDSLSPKDFVFLDPYNILEPNERGDTYLDVFLQATDRKIPVMLWYGFNTR